MYRFSFTGLIFTCMIKVCKCNRLKRNGYHSPVFLKSSNNFVGIHSVRGNEYMPHQKYITGSLLFVVHNIYVPFNLLIHSTM